MRVDRLERATIRGGPYLPLTNALVAANFADSHLNNGTTYYYVLTATNRVGESAPSSEVSATPVPSVGSKLSASLAAAGVTISWLSAYVGWILQTNTIALGNPTAWGDVPDSLTRSQMTFPARGPNTPAEFFRLRHP
jgi:hypothetical protein